MAKVMRAAFPEKGSIDLIEEAVHLLRTAPLSVLLTYYIGSMPFVLLFLYYWADMSRGNFGRSHLSEAALGLSLLYVWMKSWQSVFANHVLAVVSRQEFQRYSVKRILKAVFIQSVLQPYSFILLSVSGLVLLPLAWTYAYYQNLSVIGSGESLEVKQISARAWRLASLWPAQNHRLLLIISLFGVVVFLNIGVVLLLVPQLLQTLFGIETVFTRSGIHVLNTTFLSTVVGLSYLCLNPLTKTAYVLRCFYGEALHTGADLVAELKLLEAER